MDGKKWIKKNWQDTILIGVRVLFFVCFPAIFSTAFAGIKYLVGQIGRGGGLELNAFVITLIAVCFFTIVFGRFFCGTACAFGSYGDFVYWISCWIRKKRKKRPHSIQVKAGEVLKYGKYIILMGILALCFLQESSVVSENSPWSVFSKLQALCAPGVGMGLLFLILVTVGMYFESRFFCRLLCPMGAVFSLLPVLPFSAVKRDREKCMAGCRGCQVKCPSNLQIATVEEGDNLNMGECFSCGKCAKTCPKGNIRMGFVREKSQLFIWQCLRSVLLLALCWWLTKGI